MHVTPVWNEGFAGLEAAALLRSDTWRDPRLDGNGRAVFLIPGFMAGDHSLRLMAQWLSRSGYRVGTGGLQANVACAGETMVGLEERLEELAVAHGPAVVIGQSRGGSLARALAGQRPELVSGLVTLGTPLLNPLAVGPLTMLSLRAVSALGALGVPGVLTRRCLDGECCASFRQGVDAPLRSDLVFVSVYSQRDGIVDWRACLDPAADHVQVDASHCGMAAHAGTYDAIADALRAVGPADGWIRAA
jgi:pimeloyl-ACP methyl ester carboxylesterase